MTVLPETFALLTCLGLWRPIEWHGWKALLYNCYTLVVIFLCSSFTLAELLDLLLVSNDVGNFASNAAVFLAMVAVCGKIAGILKNRDTLLKIQTIFEKNPFKPSDDEDLEIQRRYNRLIRITAFTFIGIHEVGGASVSCSRVFADREPGDLPYRVWLPYNYSSPSIWYLSAAQQVITVFISGHINAVFDLLFPGIMFLICAQVNMLKHRFHVMIKNIEAVCEEENNNSQRAKNIERRLINEWVEYHSAVLSMSEFLHSKFSKIVFIQYSVSSIIICTTIYIMTTIELFSVEFVGNLFYAMGSVFEVFIECVSANEATLEFADLNKAIYNTNWFILSISARRSMIVIMSKTMKPIVFTCGYIFELSLESFKSIMKLSYSLYNVLIQS